jgi:6-phosphogluconolactonase/glucosamine-6-phosphate isomerase/deaminase
MNMNPSKGGEDMAFMVIVTRDFEQMSEVAAEIITESITAGLKQKEGFTLGPATGSSPTGLYKHLAGAAKTARHRTVRTVLNRASFFIFRPLL